MRTIDRCPCCGGSASHQWPALTAPFIAEYALQAPVALCQLLECGACGLRFFDGRFEEEELGRLYAEYRGKAYFLTRHRHEFWYSRRHNEGTGHDARILAARKSATERFLLDHLQREQLYRVLDYGGDSGQFIPDRIGVEKDVFEVSDAAPVPGVRRLSEEQALVPGNYDLVLLNHVLEHASDPAALLRRVASLLKEGTGILHIEVPLERYRLRWVKQGPTQSRRLARLASSPIRLRWLDFYSTFFRIALGTIPPFGFLKLHEHLNLFDEQSLTAACRAIGLEIVAVESGDRGAGTIVTALARRPGGP
jgi:SAM-dependent methyltransferase